MPRNGKSPELRWNEVFDTRLGSPRTPYSEVIRQLEQVTSSDLRELEERLDAALRELGITFELPTAEHHNTWFCDLLPQIFSNEEWDWIVRGFQQRFRAFEYLLQDIYGEREILKEGVLPIQIILGSPNYQRSAVGLPTAGDHFLHLSGLCVGRDQEGALMVKHHY